MEQQERKFSFSQSYKTTKDYVDTQIQLARLKALSRASRIAGSLFVDVSKVILTLLVLFFLAMALGFYLGELLHSNALGFLATAGILIVIILIIRVFEPNIETLFTNFTIQKITSKWMDEDDSEEDEETEEPSPVVDAQGAESSEVEPETKVGQAQDRG